MFLYFIVLASNVAKNQLIISHFQDRFKQIVDCVSGVRL
jgi:hypothetical protein